MAESVVFSIAQYLGGILVQEAELLGGVADQIRNIYAEMIRMQGFLKDADARQHESESVRNLVANIRDLAYNAEDIIETYILKAKYANTFNPKKYIRLHQIGKEIEKLQPKIQAITHQVVTCGFIWIGQGEGTSSTIERQRQLRQSYPHYDDEDVIGIQDDMKILVAKVINEEGPRLVSIAGMGGLGKTTIAKKIYNHDDIKRHFDCCAWSFISQQFQVRSILQGLIRKVGNTNEGTRLETLNDGELMEKLYRLLEGKCYLVVLDDIWSKEAWDVLKPAFPKGKKGSKIMLTTRNKDVALHADRLGFLHQPPCLTKDQSWELFCKKAFPWKNVASTSSSSSLYCPEVDTEKKGNLGRKMIKKCGGLPLAVVVLGGLLATKESIHEWEMVAEDISKYLNTAQQQKEEHHDVSWILSLSYHDLPFYLKPCFLYLGLYPEDTEIKKRELIQMWIAEGFVQHYGQGTTAEMMGEDYFIELIHRSMVQVGKRSFRGKVKTCRLHDLMRDLCLHKAKEENFLCTFDGGISSTGDVPSSSSSSIFNLRMRRHAIHFTCNERYVPMQQSSPHLRAFSLWKPSNKDESIVTLEFVCKEFNYLRVLVLENVEIDSLPKAIGKLIHLRYMRLMVRENYIGNPIAGMVRLIPLNNYIENACIEVPASIGNFRNLQFLTLIGVKRLPNVLWKMEQLTYCCVEMDGSDYDNKALRVDGLKNLRKLYLGGINGLDCKSLHQFSISRSEHLQCLGLGFCVCSSDYDWSPLSCCRSLWKLNLSGQVTKLPKLEEYPPNLTKLSLETSSLQEVPIPTLEMLPNLETLTLARCRDNVNMTKYCFSAEGFGRLQYLRLLYIQNLEELEVENGAMPCLVHLQMRDCKYLIMLPEGLRFITSLKKLEVIHMPDRFNRRLQEDGDDWHKIQHIPSIIIR